MSVYNLGLRNQQNLTLLAYFTPLPAPPPPLHTRFIIRKLDDKGIGELSFDEVYRALLLGAVPPALVTDAVRLLAAGRPGEGGGAAFLSGEAAQAYYGREGGGDVSASLYSFRGGGGGGARIVVMVCLPWRRRGG